MMNNTNEWKPITLINECSDGVVVFCVDDGSYVLGIKQGNQIRANFRIDNNTVGYYLGVGVAPPIENTKHVYTSFIDDLDKDDDTEVKDNV